jgi:CRP/FNR family transcriptional regulator
MPLFASLPSNYVDDLISFSRVRKFRKNSMILFENDECKGIHLIISGDVKILSISADGKEQIVDFLSKGDFFCENIFGTTSHSLFNVQAVSNIELLIIDATKFKEILSSDPELSLNFLNYYTQRLRDTYIRFSQMMLYKIDDRVWNYILNLARKEGVNIGKGVIKISRPTHQLIATLLGTTRESISRAINKLDAAGYLKQSRKDILIDKKHLV